VQQLAARPGLDEDSPVMRLVGYRQLLDCCRGRSSREEAAERALHATRQLAKRQLTWLRSSNLLPYGATVRRCNPFDASETEQLFRALFEG
jgi:tRNA dimethylallyltransferase